MIQQLINSEKFTNIQNAQAGLTRLFSDAEKSASFYRVMKNDRALGVLLPESFWKSITEDLEALSSPNYRAKISKARAQSKSLTADQVKKQIGI